MIGYCISAAIITLVLLRAGADGGVNEAGHSLIALAILIAVITAYLRYRQALDEAAEREREYQAGQAEYRRKMDPAYIAESNERARQQRLKLAILPKTK